MARESVSLDQTIVQHELPFKSQSHCHNSHALNHLDVVRPAVTLRGQ
jgi:hypothetical protein